MKHIVLVILAFILASPLAAQVVIYGYAVDDVTEGKLPDVQIRIPGTNISTITNADGRFTLRLDTVLRQIDASAVGYSNTTVQRERIEETLRYDEKSRRRQLRLKLHPVTTILKDVFVYSPDNIIKAAIEKIPVNYRMHSEAYSGFYRETIRKRNTYVGVSEAVVTMYKTSYDKPADLDHVHIHKGRSILSQRKKDTISVHVQGGPTEALFLDLVKNRGMLFDKDILSLYKFEIENPVTINNRTQYVISFRPLYTIADSPAFYGLIYVDYNTLSFTRIEFNMDMSDLDKATRMMLSRKPLGMRFRPRSLKTVVNYYYDGRHSDISYIRTIYNFDCDWKKRGLAVNYEAVSEMLITNHHTATEIPRRKESFHRTDVLSKQVSDFDDPHFWSEYNILQPSESLEHALKKLKKSYLLKFPTL